MSLFQEVGLQWQGKEFVVPPEKVMGLVEVIEDVITIEELAGKGVKRAKVAKAFTAAIRYAAQCQGGHAKISEEEVFESMFGHGAMDATTRVVYALLSLMIPPEHLQQQEPVGKPEATRKKGQGKATASSRKRTS